MHTLLFKRRKNHEKVRETYCKETCSEIHAFGSGSMFNVNAADKTNSVYRHKNFSLELNHEACKYRQQFLIFKLVEWLIGLFKIWLWLTCYWLFDSGQKFRGQETAPYNCIFSVFFSLWPLFSNMQQLWENINFQVKYKHV